MCICSLQANNLNGVQVYLNYSSVPQRYLDLVIPFPTGTILTYLYLVYKTVSNTLMFYRLGTEYQVLFWTSTDPTESTGPGPLQVASGGTYSNGLLFLSDEIGQS